MDGIQLSIDSFEDDGIHLRVTGTSGLAVTVYALSLESDLLSAVGQLTLTEAASTLVAAYSATFRSTAFVAVSADGQVSNTNVAGIPETVGLATIVVAITQSDMVVMAGDQSVAITFTAREALGMDDTGIFVFRRVEDRGFGADPTGMFVQVATAADLADLRYYSDLHDVPADEMLWRMSSVTLVTRSPSQLEEVKTRVLRDIGQLKAAVSALGRFKLEQVHVI